MNGADTAWIITATALVLLMTLPGLALFYGGLVRARNVLSVFMHCYAIACFDERLVVLLWLFHRIWWRRKRLLGWLRQDDVAERNVRQPIGHIA